MSLQQQIVQLLLKARDNSLSTDAILEQLSTKHSEEQILTELLSLRHSKQVKIETHYKLN